MPLDKAVAVAIEARFRFRPRPLVLRRPGGAGYRKAMPRRSARGLGLPVPGVVLALAAALTAALALSSCGATGPRPAVIWTDSPELALYAELFNASQSGYRMAVEWKADLAEALKAPGPSPDLVVGRYLKASLSRDRFQALDYLFGELTVNQAAFYPALLAEGNSGGRQLLLPVSFDLPAIVYRQGGVANASGNFLLGLEDLRKESAAFNQSKSGAYTRMGFSPRWDPDFLVATAWALGAAFREGRPLAWNEEGLDRAVSSLRSWSAGTNGSATAEDDFQFKYLYTPPYKYIAEGRALFAYMKASDLFLAPQEKRAGLDYRWYAEAGLIPVSPNVVNAGIPRAARDKSAAETFLKWFYSEDGQKAMLEAARTTRSMEGSFGIAGGFSAVRTVTERVFPQYYASLVGHLPPAEGLSVPGALPADWPRLEASVVSAWLLDATSKPQAQAGRPGAELADRLAQYLKDSGN
jgi:ABC-type glycerol-3-phosphate transport system substrate-binding protein